MGNKERELFDKAFEKIHLKKEEKTEILQEQRINLKDIMEKISDVKIKEKLNKYEEQNGLLAAEMYKRFFLRGYEEAKKCNKCNA